MEMMTNISKLTRQAGLAFAAVLWLGLNTAGISSARAADVSNTCAVQFHPCKIDGAAASRNLYPNSRIEDKILSPACASADALCDGNVPVPEAPVIENDPDPQMVTAEASLGKCGKLLPADNLSAFHQQGESGGDAGAFNKCWADDKGGCSYGVSQMVCYRDSSKWPVICNICRRMIPVNIRHWK